MKREMEGEKELDSERDRERERGVAGGVDEEKREALSAVLKGMER